MSKLLYTLISLCLFFSAEAQKKTIPSHSKIDSLFAKWTNDHKPGIAVAVLSDGKTVFKNNWGLANVENNIPITKVSKFLFPGMSDQMLSYCILLLDQRGELDLDDAISKHLGYLPHSFNNISIRQLLNHTSQLNAIEDLFKIKAWTNSHSITEEKLKKVLNIPVGCKKDNTESFALNKVGLKLLQWALEEKTQMSFSDFAKKEIFDPLKMNNSMIRSGSSSVNNLSFGYQKIEDSFELDNNKNISYYCDPLYTTTEDILIWVDNFWRPKIGPKEVWNQMDQLISENNRPVKKVNRSLYVGQHGYWDYRGIDKLYQIGMANGYAAKVVRYPSQDLAVVVLGNFSQYNGHLATILSSYYLEEYFPKPTNKTNRPLKVKLDPTELEGFLGKYWDYQGESLVSINLKNDTLIYDEPKYKWNTQLIPSSKMDFSPKGNHQTVMRFETKRNNGDLILKLPNRIEIVYTKLENETPENLKEFEGNFYHEDLMASLKVHVDKNEMFLQNADGNKILFNHLNGDNFGSTNGLYSRIKFIRNKSGDISKIKVYNNKIRNLVFDKIEKLSSYHQ